MLYAVPDRLRACDLRDDHLHRRIRVDGHVGVLHAYRQIDDAYVQLVLSPSVGMPPVVPIVGAGAPVDLLD
jgi:hypothetical protein